MNSGAFTAVRFKTRAHKALFMYVLQMSRLVNNFHMLVHSVCGDEREITTQPDNKYVYA